MTTRIIKTEDDLALLIKYLQQRKRPYTVDIAGGKHRTVEQNRLQRMWLNEAAEQLGGHAAEELRGICKLTIGVPMLRAENEKFREVYDRLLRPLDYEDKLAFMMEPLDLPVTRIMNTDQKTRYLDEMSRKFLEMGVALTDPERRKAA